MNLGNVKLLYVITCISLGLIILSPTLFAFFPALPKEKNFSELWILGPNHMMEDYPSSVSLGVTYSVFLGVGNQMGRAEYYSIQLKIRNQSDPLPENSIGFLSSLPAVCEYRLFLQNDATWEKELSFALSDVSFERETSRISTIFIDGYPVDVDKIALLDEENNVFYYELFFELWIYNSTISTFQFHNRSVGFWINLNTNM